MVMVIKVTVILVLIVLVILVTVLLVMVRRILCIHREILTGRPNVAIVPQDDCFLHLVIISNADDFLHDADIIVKIMKLVMTMMIAEL